MNYPSPRSAPPATAPTPPPASAIVDLSKKAELTLESVSRSADLQKLELRHLTQGDFEGNLAKLKTKIVELARIGHVPAPEVLNAFYRSPVYTLYVALAVAVMNDTSTDQKMVFEKLVRTYQAANKEVLTREQFLALNRFKKEVSQME